MPLDDDGNDETYGAYNLLVTVNLVESLIVVTLTAAMKLQNLLPCPAIFTVSTKDGAGLRHRTEPGEIAQIYALADG